MNSKTQGGLSHPGVMDVLEMVGPPGARESETWRAELRAHAARCLALAEAEDPVEFGCGNELAVVAAEAPRVQRWDSIQNDDEANREFAEFGLRMAREDLGTLVGLALDAVQGYILERELEHALGLTPFSGHGSRETLLEAVQRRRPGTKPRRGSKRGKAPDPRQDADDTAARVEAYLRTHPRTSGNVIAKELGLSARTRIEVLATLEDLGRIRWTRGARGARLYEVVDPGAASADL